MNEEMSVNSRRRRGSDIGRTISAPVLILALLLLFSVLCQVFLDRTPAGSGERAGDFPSAASLARFLGGIRQYFAYTFFIKTDKLYHLYGANPELIPYFIIITYLDPHYVDAYYLACGLIYDAGRRQEALDLNLRGIKANPQSADLYFSLGIWYLDEGRFREAGEAFETALRLTPNITSRHTTVRGLVAAYRRLGDLEKGRRHLLDMIVRQYVMLIEEELLPEERRSLVRRINGYSDEVFPEGREGY